MSLMRCSRCHRELMPWRAFQTGWPDSIRYWCLNHIPFWTRVMMRLTGKG